MYLKIITALAVLASLAMPTGFISCDAQCKFCGANPGCEKNIVHTDGPTASAHRCRTCRRQWIR
jgi:hypothetical protein